MVSKKLLYLFITACLLLFSACGSNNGKSNKANVDDAAIQELKTKVIDDIKAFGAKDAYFDEDDYFVDCVDPAEISANADQVAEAMFPMVEEVPGVKGCKVVDFTTKKELGRYKKK